MSAEPAHVQLAFAGVSKWYGQISALTDVSFTCGGGVTGLVGQNGAGKSTILKLACGLLSPSQGRVEVGGLSPSRSPACRARIGLCPDLERCYEQLSGLRFVTWMLRLAGLSARESEQTAHRCLEDLGLGEAMHRAIRGYSKGMRQRVKLAQAIAHDPALLILDEPMTGLDPVARHELGQRLRTLAARGISVIVSSHVLHELEAIVDRVLVVHQGRLIAEGGVGELRGEVRNRPFEVFVGSRDQRELASRLARLGSVIGIEFEEGGLKVRTLGGAAFHAEITALGAEDGGLIESIEPLDASLEAVFGYLVSG